MTTDKHPKRIQYESFNEINKEVKELGIHPTFDGYNLRYESTSRHYAYSDCPYCGAKIEDKKASIHKSKEVFTCFGCGKGPFNGISLIMDLLNLDYKEAILDIAVKTNTALDYVEKYYKALGSDIKVIKNDSTIIAPKNKKRAEIIVVPRASEEVLDKVYRVFSKGNSIIKGGKKLSEEHLKYLKGRGLSDEDIEKGKYFTFPKEALIPAILKVVKKLYDINEDVLLTVPGFYKDSKGNIRFKYYDGIGIPIISSKNLLRGIQVRLNKESVYVNSKGIKKTNRYFWLSSEGVPEGCIAGTCPGTPIDVSFPSVPKEKWSGNLFITEGKFKAQQLSKTTNSIVLSVQGVGNWREVSKEIEDIMSLTNNIIKRIFITFDADLSYKPEVNNHAKNMAENLTERFPLIPIFYCLWNPDFGKGIDDLIFNKKFNTIKISKKNVFENLYSLVVENTKKQGVDFDKLTEEIKLKIYLDCIYNKIS